MDPHGLFTEIFGFLNAPLRQNLTAVPREEEETGRGVLRCRERCGARSRPSTPHLALVEGHEAAASLGLYNYWRSMRGYAAR
jgi:hypothetical protein